MQEMAWLESHLGNLDEAITEINRFKWFLNVWEYDNIWYVVTGQAEKSLIFKSDSREAVDVFLYGMGLAYNGIPDDLRDHLVRNIEKWYEDL